MVSIQKETNGCSGSTVFVANGAIPLERLTDAATAPSEGRNG